MAHFVKEHITPPGLPVSRAYSQAIAISGDTKTIYIGGQNAVNEAGDLVGAGDFAEQSRQALRNIRAILASQGAGFEDLIKLNIYLLMGCDPRQGFQAFQEIAGKIDHPPLVTVLFVAGLGRPGFLVEIDGIAAVPASLLPPSVEGTSL